LVSHWAVESNAAMRLNIVGKREHHRRNFEAERAGGWQV
jgi:hypothetical protein